MPVEITMPQLSDTMTDGKLIKWRKKEGDKIKNGDILADIETDKAVMEMEALDSGVLAAILAKEGDAVAVGAVLGLLATGKEDPAEVKKSAGAEKAAAPAKVVVAAAPVAVAVGAGQPSGTSEMREPDEMGHGATRQPATAVPAVPHNQENGKDRLRISPVARRVAEAAQIDVQSLTGKGSGPGGRIIKQDILSFQQAPPAAAALPQRLGSGEKQTVPMTKMRLAIAKNLQASKQNIPHFYESIDVDVEELSLLRGRVNEILEPQKIRLSLGDFISKAVAVALQRNPTLNATFNGTEITRYGDVNLGMAVSVPDGLIVPVIRNIQLMGVKEIRQRTLDLVDRARAGRLKQDEMMGGTFTVSNLGVHGIREFSAIINPPQVAILAIAAATKRPVVFGGQIAARTMITFTLSADHRVIDGVTAAEFLRTLKELLEEPAMMMA